MTAMTDRGARYGASLPVLPPRRLTPPLGGPSPTQRWPRIAALGAPRVRR